MSLVLVLQTSVVEHDLVGAASGGDLVPDPPARRDRTVCIVRSGLPAVSDWILEIGTIIIHGINR